MIGQTISHYKILEKLGEGGMGVVYKARDTQLDREVALKFLPHYLTSDAAEKERFYHEARAAASLTHQNIAIVHQIGEYDNRVFIAMEYVEGETLKKVVGSESLSIIKVLDIAIQIAEGLAAAHEKGIVHRDIKSENIILNPKGQAKITDFGLAKVKGATKLTRTGSTLGTAAYMSPEQARGEEVDHRSDIFSFGVVIYELLTVHLPFRGEHPTALMYSIVNEEPVPIARFNEKATPEMERIVAKALAKDREERYQHTDDLLADLRKESKLLEYGRAGYAIQPGVTSERTATGPGPIIQGSRKRTTIIALGGLVVMVAALFYWIFFPTPSTGINPDWKQRPLPIAFSEIELPGISGDGNWIAFIAADEDNSRGLYIMNVKGGGPRLVTPLRDMGAVDVTNDGSLIVYNQYNHVTKVTDGFVIYSTGGAPRKIIQGGCFGPRFRPDGQRVGYTLGFGSPSPSGKLEFWSTGIDGKDPRREFIDSITVAGSICFSYSPDGNKVGWLRTLTGGYHQQIIIHDLRSGQETAITSGEESIEELTWVKDDKIIFTSDRNGLSNIWMVSAEGGDAVPITNITEPIVGVKSSSDGKNILYHQRNLLSRFWIVDIDSNRLREVLLDKGNNYNPAFSPDGKLIAYIVGGPSDWPYIEMRISHSHLHLMDRDGSNRHQLSFGDEVVSWPVWSPDGNRIAYGTRKLAEPKDSFFTYIVEIANPGFPKYISPGIPVGWLDTSTVQVEVGGWTTFFTSIDEPSLKLVYEDSTRARFIQDGKYIIFRDRRQGMDPAVVWIVDGTASRELQRKTARILQWTSRSMKTSGNGHILFSHRGIGDIWRMSLPDGKEENILTDFHEVQLLPDFSPSWDGKEAMIVKRYTESKLVLIENLFE